MHLRVHPEGPEENPARDEEDMMPVADADEVERIIAAAEEEAFRQQKD